MRRIASMTDDVASAAALGGTLFLVGHDHPNPIAVRRTVYGSGDGKAAQVLVANSGHYLGKKPYRKGAVLVETLSADADHGTAHMLYYDGEGGVKEIQREAF